MAEINGGIECPFCGAPTVMGTMLTVYAFRAKHRLSKSGIIADDYECVGDFIGGMIDGYPHQELTSFECSSCGQRFLSTDYRYVCSEKGIYEFVKVEKSAAKGVNKNEI